jgi:hypothetical protein
LGKIPGLCGLSLKEIKNNGRMSIKEAAVFFS